MQYLDYQSYKQTPAFPEIVSHHKASVSERYVPFKTRQTKYKLFGGGFPRGTLLTAPMAKGKLPYVYRKGMVGAYKHRGALRTRTSRAYDRKNRRTGGYAGIERKFFDTCGTDVAFQSTWTQLAPTTPAAINCISAMVQGDGESEHLGRTYVMHALYMKFNVIIPTQEMLTTPMPDVLYRFLVVLDTQTNGAAVTGTDVMQTSACSDINSFRNLQNSTRFRVLYDTGVRNMIPHNQMSDGAINSFSYPTSVHHYNFNHVFKNPIKVRTKGTTASVASITDYSISIIGISQNTILDMTFNSRLRYAEA